VRWVAVRHNDDHVHLVATLVRHDLRTAWAWKDKLNAQRACRDLEERYNLYRVGPPGTGTRRWPGSAELNKADRLRGDRRIGPPIAARDTLRRRVRTAAAVRTDEADFFARLRHAGVRIKLRHSSQNPGQITGYAVALAGHNTAARTPVWYSGGKLATDLSLPRLRARWPGGGTSRPPNAARLAAQGLPPSGAYLRAAAAVRQAGEAVRGGADPVEAATIAAAAADLLIGLGVAHGRRVGLPLIGAADLLDRSAQERRRTEQRHPLHAVRLRAIARVIGLMGAITNDEDAVAMLQLLKAIAGLADSLADLREAQHRRHQARDARTVAARLRAYALPASSFDETAAYQVAAARHHHHPSQADATRPRR
jgi:hypothetical protein